MAEDMITNAKIRIRKLHLRFPEERRKILEQLHPVMDNLRQALKELTNIKYQYFATREGKSDCVTKLGNGGRLFHTVLGLAYLEEAIPWLEWVENSLAVTELSEVQ